MTRVANYLLLALPVIAFSAALSLTHDSGGMMGGGKRSGMMGGGDRGGMMGRNMEGCMEMMEGMRGRGTQRPNEQWRQR